MNSTVTIAEWRDMETDQRAELGRLHISDRQISYAGSIGAMIDQCRTAPPDQIRCFSVAADGVIVGFFQIKRPPASPDWVPPGTATLHGLMIDARHQSKGYGRAAFAAAIDAVSHVWPDVLEFALSVDQDNDAALSLYKSFGMSDSGPIYRGRIGLEHRLVLSLRNPV